MCYYNWRGTGSPFLFPYVVNDRAYFSVPMLIWQKELSPLNYRNPQFDAFYNHYARDIWQREHPQNLAGWFSLLHQDGIIFLNFFLWPELALPLLILPLLVLSSRKVIFLTAQAVICILAFPLVVWFSPHYAAPMTATVLALVIQCLRRTRRLRLGKVRVGAQLTGAIVTVAIALTPFHTYWSLSLRNRASIEKKLDATPGQHLVVVRYAASHNVHDEWVYNGADIDHAKIVWAREIPGVSLQPLLDYFHGRQVWIVEPDRRELALYHSDKRLGGSLGQSSAPDGGQWHADVLPDPRTSSAAP